MSRVIVVGSINMDVVAQTDRMPKPGETLVGSAVNFIPGGKGANQAVAARRAGAPTLIVGAVGTDSFGDSLRDFLSGEDLEMNLVQQVDGSSGTAIIVVDSTGENSIVIIPGANDQVASALVSKIPFSEGDIVLLQDEIPHIANVEVIAAARSAGAKTVLNLAPYRPTAEDVLESVDYLIINETEFAELVGESSYPMTPPRVVGLLAEGKGFAPNIVVTLGAEGLQARLAGAMVSIPGHKVSVIDTTGAGDSFCGGFGASLAAGADPEGALRFANAAAALSVQQLGAGPSMPRREAIEAMLAGERA